jgi:hypothetical protein
MKQDCLFWTNPAGSLWIDTKGKEKENEMENVKERRALEARLTRIEEALTKAGLLSLDPEKPKEASPVTPILHVKVAER